MTDLQERAREIAARLPAGVSLRRVTKDTECDACGRRMRPGALLVRRYRRADTCRERMEWGTRIPVRKCILCDPDFERAVAAVLAEEVLP